ncbi:MAG: hypothetical protein ACRCWQ_14735 [Bacilli bacterium]
MSKKAFRVESGVDAGGFNVSNVADPRNGILDDAVNVQYFIRENTVQPFDPARTYKKDFAVTYENRLWIAMVDVPVGPFKYTEWRSIRTDPSWEVVTGTIGTGMVLTSGDYISAYSVNSELKFILPGSPAVGDTIVIQDEGKYCHLNRIVVNAPGKPFDDDKTEHMFTIPGSMKTFVYSNTTGGRWVVHTSINKRPSRVIQRTNADSPNQLASGDSVYRRSSTGHIVMQLPKYAVDGDVISTYDYEALTAVNGATMQVHPDSGHTIEDSVKTEITTYTSDQGNFVFQGTSNRWIMWDGDNRSRWIPISGDYSPQPMENLAIAGGNNVTITLPKNASMGDIIRLSKLYRNDGTVVTVNVNSASSHKIVGDKSSLVYPKFKDIPTKITNYPRVDSVTFNGNEMGAEIEVYFDSANDEWMVSALQMRQEHVDETNRSRPGVAPLAAQDEVNKNHEDGPRDDMIVTPKTLANKTSNETRRGISRIATAAELQVVTSGNHLNDVIVTPKRLNERQSTETIRGVAEVATQQETKDNTNDTHIITPKKFDGRRATDSLSGTVKLISDAAPAPATNRTLPGVGVYDWSDPIHKEPYVITPKTLDQCRAAETSRGVAYVATQSETNAQGSATVDTAMITPKKLDARRASETLAGIAEIATQDETNAGVLDTHIVTPLKLEKRRASESLAGIAEIATQVEVNAGTDDTRIITPKKFAGWLALDHFTSNAASGINHSQSLWNKVQLNIHEATETQRGTLRTATQAEANVQGNTASDITMITPLKLDARRATETLSGIAEIATQVEVDAETIHTHIVTPKSLAAYVHNTSTSNATETKRGTVETATLAETWVGNTTDGSTQAINAYQHNPFVVSPRGLNHALVNYLPKTGKAFDSDKLDGLDSLQFLRRDKSDSMNGNLTVNGIAVFGEGGYGVRFLASGTTAYLQGGKIDASDNDQKMIISGFTSKPLTSFDIIMKDHGVATIKGAKIYTSSAKPTPTEIGAYTKVEADAKFVDVVGDTMSGELSLPRLKFNSGNSNKWTVESVTNGNLDIKNNNKSVMTVAQNGDTTHAGFANATEVRINNVPTIETDGKMNWNKLKSIPAATTAVPGIVQLSNTLDDSSVTTAATANTIKILKEMIDEKAGITGAIMNDLKIRNWIRIGNVILRPNPANKTLDFIWTDEPL